MKIRPEIMRFAEAMETKLQKHDKEKGDSWKKMSINRLKELLEKEILIALSQLKIILNLMKEQVYSMVFFQVDQ